MLESTRRRILLALKVLNQPIKSQFISVMVLPITEVRNEKLTNLASKGPSTLTHPSVKRRFKQTILESGEC
jgi:hypothetical protein